MGDLVKQGTADSGLELKAIETQGLVGEKLEACR